MKPSCFALVFYLFLSIVPSCWFVAHNFARPSTEIPSREKKPPNHMLTTLLLRNTAAELNKGRIKEKEQSEKLVIMEPITQHHSI